MTVVYQNGYIPSEGGKVLKEDNDHALQESLDFILLDYGSDASLNNPRMVHSGLWLSGGTATANSTDAAYFEDAPMNSMTYEKWKPSGSAPSTWEYDHGSAEAADSICIAAHTLYTSGATFKVQYHDGTDWVDLCDAVTPQDDGAIMVLFNSVTAQRFRIFISAWTTAPEIGVFKASPSLMIEQRLYAGHTPIDLARETELRSNYSESGEYLGRSIKRTYNSTDYSIEHLSGEWVYSNWPAAQRGIEAEPFWLAWRPNKYGAVGYFQTDSVPKPQNMGITDLMSVSFSGRSLGYD